MDFNEIINNSRLKAQRAEQERQMGERLTQEREEAKRVEAERDAIEEEKKRVIRKAADKENQIIADLFYLEIHVPLLNIYKKAYEQDIEILKEFKPLFLKQAYNHHERFKGSGLYVMNYSGSFISDMYHKAEGAANCYFAEIDRITKEIEATVLRLNQAGRLPGLDQPDTKKK